MTIYDKFKAIQEASINECMGAIFSPEYATKLYNVDFSELEFTKDFNVGFGAFTTVNGVEPTLSIYFTDDGIKKLLSSNIKMINEVEELYQELLGGAE